MRGQTRFVVDQVATVATEHIAANPTGGTSVVVFVLEQRGRYRQVFLMVLMVVMVLVKGGCFFSGTGCVALVFLVVALRTAAATAAAAAIRVPLCCVGQMFNEPAVALFKRIQVLLGRGTKSGLF